MKRNRWGVAVTVCMLCAVIAYACFGIYHAGRAEAPYSVSVVIGDSSSGRWAAFRAGLNQGAREYNVYVNILTVGELLSPEEECAILQRELAGGADGVIAEPCAWDREGLLDHALYGKYALFVGTENREDTEIPVVMPDWRAIGAAVAGNMAEAGISGSIAVLSGDQRKPAMKRCLMGFLEEAAKRGLTCAWRMDEEEAGDGPAWIRRMAEEPVEAVAALDNRAMEMALRVKREEGTADSFRLFGTGRSAEVIASLDDGTAEALVVPDEYYMGYLCIDEICRQFGIQGRAGSIAGREISLLTVTQESLYQEDTEGILFPVVS